MDFQRQACESLPTVKFLHIDMEANSYYLLTTISEYTHLKIDKQIMLFTHSTFQRSQTGVVTHTQ